MLKIEEALEIIQNSSKVAIIGLSPKEIRPSYKVAKFLQDKGLKIVPINPVADKILGVQSISNLAKLKPGDVDWLDFFVSAKRLPDFLPEVLRLKPKLVWCQIEVVNSEFINQVETAEIPLIVDTCPKIIWK